MAFHDGRDFLQGGDNLVIVLRLAQLDGYKCADVEANGFRFHENPAAGDDSIGFKLLYTLVNGRARYPAFAGDFEEGHTCILGQKTQDLLVGLIELVREGCHRWKKDGND